MTSLVDVSQADEAIAAKFTGWPTYIEAAQYNHRAPAYAKVAAIARLTAEQAKDAERDHYAGLYAERCGQVAELTALLREELRLFPDAADVLTRQEMRDAKGNWRSLIDQQSAALARIDTILNREGDNATG